MEAFESVSTWRQPLPETASAERRALVAAVTAEVVRRGAGRLRVAVDGRTGAGKTSFAHELAAAMREGGRPTPRASLDDFKRPWREAEQLGYDRLTGPGYYANAHDHDAVCTLLLEPAGPAGSGRVVLCARDPLSQDDHRDIVVDAPSNAVLVVDSVFAFRPEWDPFWQVRIWLDVDSEASTARFRARDTGRAGAEEAARLDRERYRPAEAVYLAQGAPAERADIVIDNRDLTRPRLLRLRESPSHPGEPG